MVDLPVVSSVLSIIDKILSPFRTPRSKIRIEKLTDDRLTIDSSSDPDWVTLHWHLTAINDGRRDGQLASPVFDQAKFSTGHQEEIVTPDDIGRGSVGIEFREKDEGKVVARSNDRITITHRLSKNEGIHEYISTYDTMEFKYTVLVEDGSLPYKIQEIVFSWMTVVATCVWLLILLQDLIGQLIKKPITHTSVATQPYQPT